MREWTLEGLAPVHVVEWGEARGEPVILLHGLRAYGRWWDDLADELCSDHRLVAPDLRGRGASAPSPGADYRLDVMVDDVEDLVEALGATSVVLVGHSLGGLISLGYAARHPGAVSKLVILDACPEPDQAGIGRTRKELDATPDTFESWDAARDFIERAHRTPNPSRIDTRMEWMLQEAPDGHVQWRLDPVILRGAIPGDPPERVWRWVRRVRCQTLLVRGSRSDILTESMSQQMLAALPSGSRLVEVPDAGHMILDDNPKACVSVVSNFLIAEPQSSS